MTPQSHVSVDLEEGTVPGLVLRTGHDGALLLVTYEQQGHVVTSWLDRGVVHPA